MAKKTVFVFGAGASKEAGLPTGEELKSKIADLLNVYYVTDRNNWHESSKYRNLKYY